MARAPYERPTTDQINSLLWDSPPRPVLPVAATIPLAKKVLDDSPAKTEKTLPPRSAGTDHGKPNARESRILRDPAPPGDTGNARGLQNLLLNLYSLVKEHRCGKPRRK
jgi:hypothetical protein